jgi:hypothetical protein
MSEPSIAPLGAGAPSIIHPEPISSEPPPTEPLACVAPPAGYDGAGGADAGAEALVRRFGGSEGAGAGAEPPPFSDGSSCADDALRAIASCASAVSRGELHNVLGCIGAVQGFLECLANEDATKAGAKP